jgi:hypothetical protein
MGRLAILFHQLLGPLSFLEYNSYHFMQFLGDRLSEHFATISDVPSEQFNNGSKSHPANNFPLSLPPAWKIKLQASCILEIPRNQSSLLVLAAARLGPLAIYSWKSACGHDRWAANTCDPDCKIPLLPPLGVLPSPKAESNAFKPQRTSCPNHLSSPKHLKSDLRSKVP